MPVLYIYAICATEYNTKKGLYSANVAEGRKALGRNAVHFHHSTWVSSRLYMGSCVVMSLKDKIDQMPLARQKSLNESFRDRLLSPWTGSKCTSVRGWFNGSGRFGNCCYFWRTCYSNSWDVGSSWNLSRSGSSGRDLGCWPRNVNTRSRSRSKGSAQSRPGSIHCPLSDDPAALIDVFIRCLILFP